VNPAAFAKGFAKATPVIESYGWQSLTSSV